MSNKPEADDNVRAALEIFGARISGGAARELASHTPELAWFFGRAEESEGRFTA